MGVGGPLKPDVLALLPFQELVGPGAGDRLFRELRLADFVVHGLAGDLPSANELRDAVEVAGVGLIQPDYKFVIADRLNLRDFSAELGCQAVEGVLP